jgi:gliding motility-associated-like protein
MNSITSRICFLLFSFLLIHTKSYSQAPVADFSSPDPNNCAPFMVQFNDNSSNNPTSWDWDFHDPNAPGHAFIANPTHTYQNPGTYDVTLIATNGSGSNTITKTGFVRIYRVPNAQFTMSEDTVCPGTTITFTDASTPGDTIISTYEWNFNDGTGHVFTNPVQHSFPNNGSVISYYIPIYTATDAFGCSSTTTLDTAFVLPVPNASFTVNAASCTFPATVNFTNTSTQPQVFTWDFGDPSSGASNTSTQTNPSHIYATQGSYLVTLTNGVTGCSAFDTMTIQLVPPVASFVSPPKSCAGSAITFSNTSTPNTATLSWNFGDNTTSTATNPVHTYNVPSTYTVRLIASLGNCSDTITHQVLVPLRPIAVPHVNDSTACSIPFTPQFSDTDPAHVGWNWDFGDGTSTSSSQNPTHTYNNFGIYTVTLTVTDTNGCVATKIDSNWILIAPPIVQITSPQDSGCIIVDTFSFNASVNSPADPNIVSWTWNFGDGTPDTTQSTAPITHSFNHTDSFDVTVTVTTASGCTATTTFNALIKAGTRPIAVIDSVLDTICWNNPITFHSLSPQPVTGWWWFFDDQGTNMIDPNPTFIFNKDTSGTADPFDIILIAYNYGCADTDTVVDMIAVLSPIVHFATSVDCINEDSIIFTNLVTGGNTYLWDFGDQTTTSDSAPSHVYGGPGLYLVKLVSTNLTNGCITDSSMFVSVFNIDCRAGAISPECYPFAIPFSADSSQDAINVWWDFGDPASGALNTLTQSNPPYNALHTYNQHGLYNVVVVAQDFNTCTDTARFQVHMIGPDAGFISSPSTGCLNPPTGLPVTFTDTSHTDGGAISGWSWNFGNGAGWTSSASGTTTKNYTTAGLFTVRLAVVDINGCVDTATVVNGVNPTNPSAIITNNNFGCRDVSKNFGGSAGPNGTFLNPVNFQWNFGDGQTGNGMNVSHTYNANGQYTVTLTVTDANGCSSTTQQVNDIYTTSAHFIPSTTTACETVNGVKRAKVAGVFVSDSTMHTANANYDWNFSVFRDSTSILSTYNYDFLTAPGTYDVTLTLTNDYGCKDTYTVPGAVVVPGPTGSYSFTPDSGCTPLTVNFTGSSPSSTAFVWDFGDGNVTTGSMTSITHTYLTQGVYTPQFLLGFQLPNDFCYIPVDTIGVVKVTTDLEVDILEPVVVIPSVGATVPVHVSVIDHNNIGPPYTYVWNPAANVTQAGNNVFNITSEEDTSVFMVSIPYGNGCSGIDTVLVIGAPCEFDWSKIPNVFTPGDGNSQNDNYFIKDLCPNENFYIKIYNRWGRIIYESNDPQFKWDGTTTSGSEASEGTYFYVLSARKKDHHGYIELIRPGKK